MLRFRLGRIPVEVHFSHLLVNLIFGYVFALVASGGEDWPGPILRDQSSPAYTQTLLLVVLVWMGVISVSALIYELGHAVFGLLFGYEPAVHLIGMGGITRARATPAVTSWQRELGFVLGGPVFGLALTLLAGTFLLAMSLLGIEAPVATYVLRMVAVVNLVWTGLNLLPVPPLDAGRAALLVLQHVFGRRGFLLAQLVSLGFSMVLVMIGLIGWRVGLWWMAVIFALHGMRALTSVLAYMRGEQPMGGAAHPLLLLMESAESLAREGKYDESRRIAGTVLSKEPPPLVRSHAHRLLGWLEVKAGEGRKALDHFAQVQGLPVPPQFLAAAFSLVGDDGRAVALWEQAAAVSPDPVVWHEFAGALLRLGREHDVRRLPQVRPALAWEAAQRVHFLRGEFAQAAQACEAAFREEPSSRSAYDAGCAWARAGDAAAAQRMLTLAAQNGFSKPEEARDDPDLASLRGRPEFEAWLEGLPKKADA